MSSTLDDYSEDWGCGGSPFSFWGNTSSDSLTSGRQCQNRSSGSDGGTSDSSNNPSVVSRSPCGYNSKDKSGPEDRNGQEVEGLSMELEDDEDVWEGVGGTCDPCIAHCKPHWEIIEPRPRDTLVAKRANSFGNDQERKRQWIDYEDWDNPRQRYGKKRDSLGHVVCRRGPDPDWGPPEPFSVEDNSEATEAKLFRK